MDINFTLGGVGLIGFLVALGQLYKSWGLESKWVPGPNLIVALAVVCGVQYSRGGGDIEVWITAVVVAMTIALAASGLYSETKALRAP
ncbi:MAG: hypothetical protein V1755_02910 [Chloroflexota bacterium]